MGNRQCYKLTGVIIHVPNMEAEGGHYTCYFQSRNQNQWFYADDTQVSFFNNIFPIIDYYLCMTKKLFTQIFIYISKPLRLLYSLIIYEIVNFSFFALYSLLLLSLFLYLKSVPIYVIVHVHVHVCEYMH